MAEALHLLGKAARDRRSEPWYGQAPLADLVAAGGVQVPDFTAALGARSLNLMHTYADRPMDFADASLVALAEATADLRIVSFDADFRIYRTADGRALEVLWMVRSKRRPICTLVSSRSEAAVCRPFAW
jgi:hypothetical protein